MEANCNHAFKAVSTGSNSLGAIPFTSTAEVYASAQVLWPTASTADWISNGFSPQFFQLILTGTGILHNFNLAEVSGVLEWRVLGEIGSMNFASPVATPDEWHELKIHRTTAHTDIWIDGTQIINHTNGSSAPNIDRVRIGLFGSPNTGTVYIDDVKVGTTDGGTDLLGDDFETDTLVDWDPVGDCSIVLDPYTPCAGDKINFQFGVR